MASGQNQLASSVLVKLSVLHLQPNMLFPERRILLESDKRDIKIGRTSKRIEELEARMNNCYFDSPVMSREHAEFMVDWSHKRVYITDMGSLHGTFKNSSRMEKGVPQEVAQGDILKFGIDIQRGTDLFPPWTVEVYFEFDPSAVSPVSKLPGRPTFSVPDDTDSSDEEDDDDDDTTKSDIYPTVEKLRKINMGRQELNLVQKVPEAIDLTGDAPTSGSETRRHITIVIDDDAEETVLPSSSAPNPSEDAPGSSLDVECPREVVDICPWARNEVDDLSDVSDIYSHSDDSLENDDFGNGEEDEEEDDISSQEPLSDSIDDDISLGDCTDASDSDSQSEFDSQDEEDEEPENYDESMSGDEGIRQPQAMDSSSRHSKGFETNDGAGLDGYLALPNSGNLKDFNKHLRSTVSSLVGDKPSIARINEASLTLPHASDMVATSPQCGPSQDPQNRGLHQLMAPHQHPIMLPPFHNFSRTKMSMTSHQHVPGATFDNDVNGHSQGSLSKSFLQSPALPQNDGPSAEDLGKRAGKTDYFLAREYNKTAMRRHEETRDPSPLHNYPVLTVEDSASVVPAISEWTSKFPDSKSAKIPEYAWETTGNLFLNTPQEIPLSNIRGGGVEFDMTSAFQFQQSRLATSSTPARTSPITAEKEDDELEQLIKPPKRKAEAMSTLLPEEEKAEATLPEQTGPMPKVNEKEVDVALESSTASSSPDLAYRGPPAKRFRFLPSWDTVGAFSVGGLMMTSVVVGMLASTAPPL